MIWYVSLRLASMYQCPQVQSTRSHKCNDVSIALRPDSRWVNSPRQMPPSVWVTRWSFWATVSGIYLFFLKILYNSWRLKVSFLETQVIKSFLLCGPLCMVTISKFWVLLPPSRPEFLDIFILLNQQVYWCPGSNIFVSITHITPRSFVISITVSTLQWLRSPGVPPD